VNKTEPRYEEIRSCAQSHTFVKQSSGRVRDHYWLGKVLGEGAFGEVRVGNHNISGEDRAIKFISKKDFPPEDQHKLE
jgi:hypothetical protein